MKHTQLFFLRWILGVAFAATIVSGLVVAQTPSANGFIDKTPRQGFAPLVAPACPSWQFGQQQSAYRLANMGFSIPTVAKKMTRNLAVDIDGNFYVAGYSEGAGLLDYQVIKFNVSGPGSFTGAMDWFTVYHSGPVLKKDKAYGLTVDNAAGVYVTGESDGGATKTDIVTVKHKAASGNQLWLSRYDGGKKDMGYAIAMSPDGSKVYVTGESDLGSGRGIDFITLAYNASTGTILWASTYDGPAHKKDKAYAIAVDPVSGDVVVTGESDGGSGSKSDYAVVKYNGTTGAQMWVARYNNTGVNKNDYPFALAIDGSGNIYVTGGSDGGATKFDYATVKYSSGGGAPVWVQRYNNSAKNKNDVAYALALDAGGNVYVTGGSEGLKYDYATIKYAADGTPQWTTRYDRVLKDDVARGIAVADPIGAVFVTGSSVGTTKADFLTLRLNIATGAQEWAGRFNGAGSKDDISYNVVFRRDQCIVLAGTEKNPDERLTVMQGDATTPVPGPAATVPIGHNGEEESSVSEDQTYALNGNYPNPFNPTTTINFDLAQPSLVTLKVYNTLGQEVATLLDHEEMSDGNQETDFDASRLSSGVYFYRLVAEQVPDDEEGTPGQRFTEVKKMLMMK